MKFLNNKMTYEVYSVSEKYQDADFNNNTITIIPSYQHIRGSEVF